MTHTHACTYCLRILQLYKDIRTLRLYVGGLGRWGRSGESACRGTAGARRAAAAGAPRAAEMRRCIVWLVGGVLYTCFCPAPSFRAISLPVPAGRGGRRARSWRARGAATG